MTSRFKVGPSSGSLTSLDALTTPVPDPQPEYRKYATKVQMADGSYFGRGSARVVWEFPILDVAEEAQLRTSLATTTHIQSPDVNDDDQVYQVTPNLPDPRESGDHMAGFKGYRSGLLVEFIVLAEVP